MLLLLQIVSLYCLIVLSISSTPATTKLSSQSGIEDIDLEENNTSDLQSNTTHSYLISLLTSGDLYGKWYNQEIKNGQLLQTHGGFSEIPHLKKHKPLNLCLFSGLIKNSESSCVKFNITPSINDGFFNDEDMTLTFLDVFTYIEELRGSDLIERYCVADLAIKFASKIGDQLFDPSYDIDIDKENMAVFFEIQRSNCSVNIVSRLLFPRYHNLSLANILDYLIDIVLIGFTVQLLASRWVSENLLSAYKNISLGKLLIIQAFDFYVAFQYWLGETSKIKPAKSIPAPSIMMILAFMASMIHAVAQRQKRLDQPEYFTVRFLNYSLWILIPGAALTASLVWKEHRAILLVGCLYEIPQIVQNFLTQTKYTCNLSILIFLIIPKAAYIGWTLIFADIILGYNCDREINVFCFLMILQIILMVIQTQRPKLWKRIKSLYKIRSQCKIEDMEEACAICLESTPQLPVQSHCWFFGRNSNDGEMIVTPCNHQFHQRCLKNWIKHHLSCPYCRCHLPSMP